MPILARVTPFVWRDQTLVAWKASEWNWVPDTPINYFPFRTKIHVASLADAGSFSLIGTYDTGWVTPEPGGNADANIWSETQLAPVGDHLVVYVHRRILVVSLPGAALEQALDAPAMEGIALLPIDDDSVMMAGTPMGSPETGGLAINVLHVPDGSVESEGSVPVSPRPRTEIAPCFEACTVLAASVTLVRASPATVIAVYVGTDGNSIMGILLGLDGTQLAGPVSLATSDREIFLPSLSLLKPGNVGMVWTGESGTEVRLRVFPADLQQVDPEQGAIVNADTSGTQEWARIAPTGDGGAIIVWSSGPDSGLLARYLPPGGQDRLAPDHDVPVTNQACFYGWVAASLAATAHGIVAAWPGRTAVEGGTASSIAARFLSPSPPE